MNYIITIEHKDDEKTSTFFNVEEFYIDEESINIHYDYMDIEAKITKDKKVIIEVQ